ncbi:hypothetical protein PHYSODRAFT_293675 [Phytophthora sojae]|uniref:Uncharacterized protein n=1 Tax=Phytophthora sojae (strain P6497) TaxID=1094619 RepID=G4YFX6_PHYSP|nr:hypothetical protein PHYSODRAFT_293675 [Phytophthora sojae]EGZ28025.1 hypothetical protein PHYSODRAFT_293675 [Phytophthora sojae]|eukprot:XP_009515300.1 hypothetical protein PHYSODRAFT_293675 [Phytophthora sojae]
MAWHTRAEVYARNGAMTNGFNLHWPNVGRSARVTAARIRCARSNRAPRKSRGAKAMVGGCSASARARKPLDARGCSLHFVARIGCMCVRNSAVRARRRRQRTLPIQAPAARSARLTWSCSLAGPRP